MFSIIFFEFYKIDIFSKTVHENVLIFSQSSLLVPVGGCWKFYENRRSGYLYLEKHFLHWFWTRNATAHHSYFLKKCTWESLHFFSVLGFGTRWGTMKVLWKYLQRLSLSRKKYFALILDKKCRCASCIFSQKLTVGKSSFFLSPRYWSPSRDSESFMKIVGAVISISKNIFCAVKRSLWPPLQKTKNYFTQI